MYVISLDGGLYNIGVGNCANWTNTQLLAQQGWNIPVEFSWNPLDLLIEDTGVYPYDFRTYCDTKTNRTSGCEDTSLLSQFLNRDYVQESLGVIPKHPENWTAENYNVYRAISNGYYWTDTSQNWITDMDYGIRIMMYSGINVCIYYMCSIFYCCFYYLSNDHILFSFWS